MIERAFITRHAWLRFVTRYHGLHGQLPRCPRNELRRLMADASPEDLGAGTAIRLMANRLEPAAYFCTGDWRFVTTEDVTRLLTVEVIVLRKPSRMRKKRRKRH